MRLLITAGLALLLTACDYRYRYPCQDVTKWNDARCQKPLCEVHQECPHHILGDDTRSLVEEHRRGQQGKSR